MRWIKMNDNFFDGYDELYHRAKFGEYRTMRAGCRLENVVFVFTGMQDAAKRQTAGIKFTHRPKIRFFSPRRGDTLHRFTSNLAGPTGTWVRLAVQNITSIVTGAGNAAPKYQKKFHFWVNSRPAGATPLTDFENF